MKMKKIYRMLLAIVLMGTMTTAEAQTNGFNRLKNVDTQHVANLAGGMRFAPDVTMEEAHALPGTVAYAAFEDNKVTQLSAQGIDVVNVIVPAMKAMIKENFDEQTYYALRDSAVARVKSSMSGVMGTMLVGHINKFTYDDFKNWVDEIDATMYYEATDKGYRLYFNSPKFPLNAGDLQSYFVGKVNSALSVYRGTLQEMAYSYLSDYEEMLPAVYSISGSRIASTSRSRLARGMRRISALPTRSTTSRPRVCGNSAPSTKRLTSWVSRVNIRMLMANGMRPSPPVSASYFPRE